MNEFDDYLLGIDNPDNLSKMKDLLQWVATEFPSLKREIKWKQPMFINHGTFIIAFSYASKHISVAPEQAGMERFKEDIKKSGYAQSKMLFRIKWTDEVDYDLLRRVIGFNIDDKKDFTTFWR